MDEKQGGTPNPLNPNPGASNNSDANDLVSKFVARMNEAEQGSESVESSELEKKEAGAIEPAQNLGPDTKLTNTTESKAEAIGDTDSSEKTDTTENASTSEPTTRTIEIRRPETPVQPVIAKTQETETLLSTKETMSTVQKADISASTQIAAESNSTSSPAQSASTMQTVAAVEQPKSVMPPVVVQSATNAPQPTITEVDPNRKQKRKRRLIIAGILAVFIAVGCGVAAVLLIINRKPVDMVGIAIQKLLSKSNNNVAIDGTIEVKTDDPSSVLSKMKIDLDTKLVGGTAVNATTANLTLTPRGTREEITADLGEIYANSGDLYIKVDGLADAIQSLNDATINASEAVKKCVSEDGVESCIDTPTAPLEFLEPYVSLVDKADGEWIRISSEELGSLTSGITADENAGCAVAFAEEISSSTNSLSVLYQKYPFVTSVSEGLPVAQKDNPIYQLSVDNISLNNFIKGAQELDATANLFDCMGYVNNSVNVDNLTANLSALPTLYVEVDNEYNFTRLYFDYKLDKNSLMVDLDFSYPDNLNIVEPVEYQDINILLQDYAQGTLNPETDVPTDTQTTSE